VVIAVEGSNGCFWGRRQMVAPFQSVVFDQGKEMEEQLGIVGEGAQCLRWGRRLVSTRFLEGGNSSPRRAMPHQAVRAMARAHSSWGEPLDHCSIRACIMPGEIGLRGAFFCFSPGHRARMPFLIIAICGGISKGKPLIRCHAAMAERLPRAVLSLVLPTPLAMKRETIFGLAGRALVAGMPHFSEKFMKRWMA
jgi:hypothetical protein